MREIILLRLDAPLMSFGAPIVDNYGVVQPYPALSSLTGLIANALGYDHRDTDKLQRLQERLLYAVRRDIEGHRLRDFQTVALGQQHLSETGWTTRGSMERRGGGEAKEQTHIRYRDYWADAVYTVAVALSSPEESPTIDNLEGALKNPERPLFIGRKCCLPSTPIFLRRTSAEKLLDTLRLEKPVERRRPHRLSQREKRDGEPLKLSAWWPAAEGGDDLSSQIVPVTDERDWINQVHVGRRLMRHGLLEIERKRQ